MNLLFGVLAALYVSQLYLSLSNDEHMVGGCVGVWVLRKHKQVEGDLDEKC